MCVQSYLCVNAFLFTFIFIFIIVLLLLLLLLLPFSFKLSRVCIFHNALEREGSGHFSYIIFLRTFWLGMRKRSKPDKKLGVYRAQRLTKNFFRRRLRKKYKYEGKLQQLFFILT